MKIYTKTGDKRNHGTFWRNTGSKRPHSHRKLRHGGRIEFPYRTDSRPTNQSTLQKILVEIQDRLFTVGAILATPPEKEVKKNGELRLKKLGIVESDIELLETEIDSMEEAFPPMTHFVCRAAILPCHIVILPDAFAVAPNVWPCIWTTTNP